jgi:hypothetical protein
MTEEILEDLHSRILENEAKSKRKILMFSLAPVVVGMIWFGFVWTQVDKLKQQSERYLQTIEADKQKIALLEQEIKNTTVFVSDVVDVEWSDVKAAMMSSPQAGELLHDILDLKNQYNPPFNINGHSPEEGFNSPAMMRYLLARMNIMHPGEYATSMAAIDDQLGPSKVQISNIDELKSGDLVIYRSGYVMLYINSRDIYNPGDRKKYSIGMTPFGILALRPDFNGIDKVYRIFEANP